MDQLEKNSANVSLAQTHGAHAEVLGVAVLHAGLLEFKRAVITRQRAGQRNKHLHDSAVSLSIPPARGNQNTWPTLANGGCTSK